MDQASRLDEQYPAALRDEFFIPTFGSMDLATANDSNRDDPVYYLCGNSLGCMPKNTREAVNKELDAWAARGVESHFRHPGEFEGCTSWVDIDLPVVPLLAPVVGAKETEVSVMGSLTANLNGLLVSFYRPTKNRFKILFEKSAFPSDYYAFFNQCKLHGLDPEDTLIQLSPRSGETYLRTQDILDAISENKDSLALVCLPGVQYYSGQLFDIAKITKFAHSFPGIVVGWDLAHAAGNVPLKLHEWGVDFACWCSYKYLNSGPGAMAGIFVHEKYGTNEENSYIPRLAGWWGNNRERRFQMKEHFEPIAGALGFRQSNPSVIDVVSIRSSLELFQRAGGMEKIRERSLKLTSYLSKLLQSSKFYRKKVPSELNADLGFTIITPVDDESSRGAQLSLLFFPHSDDSAKDTMERIFTYINDRGVIADERRPDVIRVAPAPLYNTFSDVYKFVELLNEALQKLANMQK